MNTRIEVLIEQCTVHTEGPPGIFLKEQFARRIIEDAILIASQHVGECEGTDHGLGPVVREYFGI